jgi:TolB-like protein/tetratricopeptide (TPR) repeat protein
MVAVLPFVNTSGNSAHDFLSLGLMDEIIVSLQRFKAFPVVSRGAMLTFQRGDKSVTEIAGELQAQYVVDSSMRANEDSLRVLVTMSDRNGDQIWAKPFDLASDFEELFSMTDELAASIAGAVRDSEVERVEVVGRPPVAAWEHYIKGLSVILDWRRERHLDGRNHIKRALELDPDMAEAWWALGEYESMEAMVSSVGEEESRMHLETSIDYFRRAHELSPFLGGACGCLGLSLEALNRIDEAFILLDEALEANPLSATLRIAYAQALANQGRFEEAVVMAESGTRMEPMGRDLALAWLVKATADLAENRSDEARKNIYRAIYAHPRDVLVTPTAIVILYVLGDRDAAARLYQEFAGEVPEFSFENPLTTATLKPIAKVIASQHLANPEFLPNALAIVDDLASKAAASAN